MVVSYYKLDDIKIYELTNNVSVLDMLNNLTINNLVELVKLGNNKCDDETAMMLIDNALESGLGLVDIHEEIKNCLFGRSMDKGEDGVDITKYTNLTGVFMSIAMQMTSAGMSFSEFWSMNTVEMHMMFQSIVQRVQNDTNRELEIGHILASMIAQAMHGKLGSEAPRMEISTNNEEADEDLDYDTMKNILMAKQLERRYGEKKDMEV